MSGWPLQCLRAPRGNLTRPYVCAWGSSQARQAVQQAYILGKGRCSASPEAPQILRMRIRS